MDKIYINNLVVFANHGVYPEEKRLGQKFLLSAILYTDTRVAGKSDALSDAINYGEVSGFIKRFMEENTFDLLEAVVERLAEEMLLSIPNLFKVNLKISKPWAPIGILVDDVAVEIERQWHEAFIALGSNMGDKKQHLDLAVRTLGEIKGCVVEEVSSFMMTKPYGYTNQEDFLNGCLKLRTLFTPLELLDTLQKIEQQAKRERTIHWGPRTLDLDILLYDDLILDSERLHIPHVEMHKRDFVLKPMAELAPYKRHPIKMQTIQELLEALNENE